MSESGLLNGEFWSASVISCTEMVLEVQAAETSAHVVAATPFGRIGQPIELATGMLFLASSESSFMTGAELMIDGGYLAQ